VLVGAMRLRRRAERQSGGEREQQADEVAAHGPIVGIPPR
jgi:hypothetical protein